jgi:hypothetical protein
MLLQKHYPYHSIPMPQRKLPVEILEEVFRNAPPSFITDDHGFWKGYAPILVCKYWKRVADGSSCLWSTISTEVNQWGRSGTTDLLKLWLRKSGATRGLVIKVVFPIMAWPKDPHFLYNSYLNIKAISVYAERWESLCIPCLTHQEAEVVFCALVSSKQLKNLDLLIPYATQIALPATIWNPGQPYAYSSTIPDKICLDNLRDLTIRSQYRAYHHIAFAKIRGPQVTTLSLSGIEQLSAASFAAVCQDFPFIGSLTFRNTSFQSTPPTWSSRETFDAKSWGKDVNELIALPKLKTLRFYGYLRWEIPHVILRCGSSLAGFTMELDPHGDMMRKLVDALENCPLSVTSITLYCHRVRRYGYTCYIEQAAAGLERALFRLEALSSFRIDIATLEQHRGNPEPKRDMTPLIQIARSRNFRDIQPASIRPPSFLDVTFHILCG